MNCGQTISVDNQQKQASAVSNKRIVLVSNREPYTVKVNEETIRLEKTPGGLVSALDPVLRQNRGLWICWEGATKRMEEFDETPTLADLTEIQHAALPYDIQTVALTEAEINHYYYGYANTRLWPLFHYFPTRCDFTDDKGWPSYQSANSKFAEKILEQTTDDDLIWVQDYHLFLVPAMVREQARQRKIGFFCHIPFPSLDVFRILPKRQEILLGLLGCDLIGFHIPQYVDYFLECVHQLLPEGHVHVDFEKKQIRTEGRLIQVEAFPISIDFKLISKLASSEPIQKSAKELKELYPTELIGIGLDRLDYTKGILERLEAIRIFFEKYPEYKKRLTFVQIASPTRTEVKMYQEMKEQVEQAVGRINGLLAEDSWAPIQYFYRSMSLQEIIPYFLIADFALTTPLRDGMNLVAKEFCAAKLNNDGLLILSEFTGAAHELQQALLVNPFDLEEVADTIYSGLQLSKHTRQTKMSLLRETIARSDIHSWVQNFLECFNHVTEHCA
jgi:alpha,alpha-trehalose-phosphate synthase [UDP-forming]